MILQHLNYIHVAVCALIYFALGSVWFSPVLFSKAWMKGHNIVMPSDEVAKERMKKQMPGMMATTLVVCFVMTIAMACIVSIFGSTDWMVGAKIGLLGSAFVIGAIGLSHMYTGKKLSLTLIDAGYHILGLIVVGIVLSVWR